MFKKNDYSRVVILGFFVFSLGAYAMDTTRGPLDFATQMQFIRDNMLNKFAKWPVKDMERLAEIERAKAAQRIYYVKDFIDENWIATSLKLTQLPFELMDEDRLAKDERDRAVNTKKLAALLGLGEDSTELIDIKTKLENLMAPDGEQAQALRETTKYRAVVGPLAFYSSDKPGEKATINVATMTAINLFSSFAEISKFTSFTGDKAEFDKQLKDIKGGKSNFSLKEQEFTAAYKLMAKLVVAGIKKSGNESLVMPAFGCGVYLKSLSAEAQTKARKIIYLAFSDAAVLYNLPITFYVWEKDPGLQVFEEAEREQSGQMLKRHLGSDIMNFAMEQSASGTKFCLLVPGSDRTVAGNYHKDPALEKFLPLEEKIAQRSDLVLLHSVLNVEQLMANIVPLELE